MATFDNGGTMYGGSVQSLGLGVLPTKGDDVIKQLNQSLEEQRRRKKLIDAPANRSLQFMPPATRDLLGSGGYGMGGT